MRIFFYWAIFFQFTLLACTKAAAPAIQTGNLLPVPAELSWQDGKFRLDKNFRLNITGTAHDRLYRGSTRFLRRLDAQSGLFLPQTIVTAATKETSAALQIRVKRAGKVALHENETYALTVTPSQISLEAETDLGVLRAYETLLQLVSADETGFFLPAVQITDRPRFPWRGLLMDVGRHFMPVEVVKRNLDGMAAVKMNVLHLHLSEDQGFPIESKIFPKLHQLGSNGQYFTQEQIKELIRYADDRGIRVVPEFDIPGHATAWFVGHPELASGPGPYTIEKRWGVLDPVMDPTKESTYKFLDAFLKEMTALFPDEYFHIGGDENNGKQWKANAQIQAYMKANKIATLEDLHSRFNERILKMLTQYKKRMVGWDEILQPGITKSIVIQSWRGRKYLYEAAQKGYTAILSNGYYIDLVHPAVDHYLNDPLPADNPLTPEQQKLIIGGEATMWSELVTPETVDSRIWPRTAAIAERLWSPREVTEVADMYRRLESVSLNLEALGLQHERNYPVMLRRLTNGQDITPIKNLVDVIEPVKGYTRHSQGVTYTTFSPYTLVADAARPDAKTARDFSNLVKSYAAKPDPQTAARLTYWLNLWKQNHAQLQQTLLQAPALREIETLSADLAAISQIGLDAMSVLSAPNGPAAQNQKAALSAAAVQEALKAARKPRGRTELMVVNPIEELVKMAAKK